MLRTWQWTEPENWNQLYMRDLIHKIYLKQTQFATRTDHTHGSPEPLFVDVWIAIAGPTAWPPQSAMLIHLAIFIFGIMYGRVCTKKSWGSESKNDECVQEIPSNHSVNAHLQCGSYRRLRWAVLKFSTPYLAEINLMGLVFHTMPNSGLYLIAMLNY